MFIDSNLRNYLACDTARDLAPDEFFDIVTEAIRPEMPYLARGGEQPVEILEILDYGQRSSSARWDKLGNIPGLEEWSGVEALVNTGGSEGTYLDVSLVTHVEKDDDCRRVETPLFVFKTLHEGPDAYAAMGALGGMITYAVELFLMTNL